MTRALKVEDEEEVPPRPSALIESLRSFGYSPATAIADLLDNSITAGADHIGVQFNWDGADSTVIVLDDGAGMSEHELRDAMRAGSSNPLEKRTSKDLGRFGLGLKTASFSQARSLTVATKQRKSGPVVIRRWDLDHVGRTNRWSLLKTSPPGAEEHLAMLDGLSAGSLVIWNELDRIVDDRPRQDEKARSAFFAVVDQVRSHLEMVFHRMIEEDGLEIRINSQLCRAWDPFLSRHKKTEKQPSEDRKILVPNGHAETLRIQPFVLPHRSELSPEEHSSAAGPRGWNLQQGFYLYRARRLIVAGDWFNPHIKPEEHHKLARIRVEITQEMDADWNLDVRKARAHPPAALREDFQRIARATREKAEAVYRHRGHRSVGRAAKHQISPVWQVTDAGGKLKYRINRDHPIIKAFSDSLTGETALHARSVLQLVEGNLPVASILSEGFRDEERLPGEETEVSVDIMDAMADVFRNLCASGHDELSAKEILLACQPFDRYPSAVEALEMDS
jgi:hypothetical protein